MRRVHGILVLMVLCYWGLLLHAQEGIMPEDARLDNAEGQEAPQEHTVDASEAFVMPSDEVIPEGELLEGIVKPQDEDAFSDSEDDELEDQTLELVDILEKPVGRHPLTTRWLRAAGAAILYAGATYIPSLAFMYAYFAVFQYFSNHGSSGYILAYSLAFEFVKYVIAADFGYRILNYFLTSTLGELFPSLKYKNGAVLMELRVMGCPLAIVRFIFGLGTIFSLGTLTLNNHNRVDIWLSRLKSLQLPAGMTKSQFWYKKMLHQTLWLYLADTAIYIGGSFLPSIARATAHAAFGLYTLLPIKNQLEGLHFEAVKAYGLWGVYQLLCCFTMSSKHGLSPMIAITEKDRMVDWLRDGLRKAFIGVAKRLSQPMVTVVLCWYYLSKVHAGRTEEEKRNLERMQLNLPVKLFFIAVFFVALDVALVSFNEILSRIFHRSVKNRENSGNSYLTDFRIMRFETINLRIMMAAYFLTDKYADMIFIIYFMFLFDVIIRLLFSGLSRHVHVIAYCVALAFSYLRRENMFGSIYRYRDTFSRLYSQTENESPTQAGQVQYRYGYYTFFASAGISIAPLLFHYGMPLMYPIPPGFDVQDRLTSSERRYILRLLRQQEAERLAEETRIQLESKQQQEPDFIQRLLQEEEEERSRGQSMNLYPDETNAVVSEAYQAAKDTTTQEGTTSTDASFTAVSVSAFILLLSLM